MYIADSNLGDVGDLKSFLKKSRAFIHKFIPRELSPTRLLEKYTSDQQKKANAKATALKAEGDAEHAAQLETLRKAGEQMNKLKDSVRDGFAPGVVGAAGLTFPASAGAAGSDAPAAPAGSLSPVVLILGAGAVLTAIYLLRMKR